MSTARLGPLYLKNCFSREIIGLLEAGLVSILHPTIKDSILLFLNQDMSLMELAQQQLTIACVDLVLEKTNFEWLCSRRGETLQGHVSQQRDKRSLVYEVA
jgi:hypothetical protein